MRELTLPPINEANYQIGYGIKVSILPNENGKGSHPRVEKLVGVGSGRNVRAKASAFRPSIKR